MLNDRNLIVDSTSSLRSWLLPWIDDSFGYLDAHVWIPNSIYVIGRQQMETHTELVIKMSQDPRFTVIYDYSSEGSQTMIFSLELREALESGRILLIPGAPPADQHIPCLVYEHLMYTILDYWENRSQMDRIQEIYDRPNKPYTFLFLNGRGRPHRRYLLERFYQLDLLDRALWSWLDPRGWAHALFHIPQATLGPPYCVKSLPGQYELPDFQHREFQDPQQSTFDDIKGQLFDHQWGEIYLYAEPYIDTYFSVVTETLWEQGAPSFRTEKIAKPLAQGHPWICAANPGFYRDIRNLGFRTFDHVIDERFDAIDDPRDRMERIVEIVRDLTQQDLASFLRACEPVCKYNQQRLAEFTGEHRQAFPDRFREFLTQHARP